MSLRVKGSGHYQKPESSAKRKGSRGEVERAKKRGEPERKKQSRRKKQTQHKNRAQKADVETQTAKSKMHNNANNTAVIVRSVSQSGIWCATSAISAALAAPTSCHMGSCVHYLFSSPPSTCVHCLQYCS